VGWLYLSDPQQAMVFTAQDKNLLGIASLLSIMTTQEGLYLSSRRSTERQLNQLRMNTVLYRIRDHVEKGHHIEDSVRGVGSCDCRGFESSVRTALPHRVAAHPLVLVGCQPF